MSSLDQIPFRKEGFGKFNAINMDLGLNIKCLNFPKESKLYE